MYFYNLGMEPLKRHQIRKKNMYSKKNVYKYIECYPHFFNLQLKKQK